MGCGLMFRSETYFRLFASTIVLMIAWLIVMLFIPGDATAAEWRVLKILGWTGFGSLVAAVILYIWEFE